MKVALVCFVAVLVAPTIAFAQAGQKAVKKLSPAEIEAQVHANFEMWPAGQVVARKGPGPKGISCGDICRVFGLDGCYERGKPSRGTYGRAGSCTVPMTSARGCFCESERRDFGFFFQEAVTIDSKVYRRVDDVLYGGDPATRKITRTKLPKFGRGALVTGGPFIAFLPGNVPLTSFVRVDTRTGKLLVTKPKKPDVYTECHFLPGVDARAWFCEHKVAAKEVRYLMIDAATSKQYELPPLDFQLTKYTTRANWDGKRLLVGRQKGPAWDVLAWKPSAPKVWKPDTNSGHPTGAILSPDDKGAATVYAAGVFGDGLASMSLASRAQLPGFWGERSRAQWIGETLYVPTRDGLWAFDKKAEKWTTWKLDRATTHHGMFVVGDTVVVGDYMLHRPSGQLRRLPLNLNAVFVGPYALIHRGSCPKGESCVPLSDKPVRGFPDVVTWRLDVDRLSADGAISPENAQTPPPE